MRRPRVLRHTERKWSELGDIIPQLYKLAYTRYRDEGDDMRSLLSEYRDTDDKYYDRVTVTAFRTGKQISSVSLQHMRAHATMSTMPHATR